MIANVNRNPKKRNKAYTPEDFMPKYELFKKATVKMSPEKINKMFETFADFHNKREARGNG